MTRFLSTCVFSSTIILGLLVSGITGESNAADPASTPVLNANQQAFFDKVKSMCSARFEGESVFPEDWGDSFSGKFLVAVIETCGDDEIRIPAKMNQNPG